MDVMRAEAEVSKRDQDLTVARTNLQLQESLMKNALTKSLDDPVWKLCRWFRPTACRAVTARPNRAGPGPDHRRR